jgi:hypothetical protein
MVILVTKIVVKVRRSSCKVPVTIVHVKSKLESVDKLQ